MILNQAKKEDIIKLEGCLKSLILKHNPKLMKSITKLTLEKELWENPSINIKARKQMYFSRAKMIGRKFVSIK